MPALHCDPSFFSGVRPAYDPTSKAAEQVMVSRAKAYAAGCERRFGWLLPHMTTADNARDMDAIRAALGAPKMSYFAYSYGTYLGQVYATLFPGHVRRMVLDSTVGPGGVWYQDNINQDYAFQGRANAFFAWVAQHNDALRARQHAGAGRRPVPGGAAGRWPRTRSTARTGRWSGRTS